MTAVISSIIAIGALVAAPRDAHALSDNYPVCLRVYGPANYDECRYTSIGACQVSASGRSAQCLINPYFVAGDGEAGQPRRHRRR